jgi:hypothetical protein
MDITKTIAYALRKFSASISKRNAQQLTGNKYPDMVLVKKEIMDMAEAVEGKGTGRFKTVTPLTFKDSTGMANPIQGVAAADDGGLVIVLDGYGHKEAPPGHGYIFALELYKGMVRGYAWTDVNKSDPKELDFTAAQEMYRLPDETWEYLDYHWMESHISEGKVFFTTAQYWDCECEEDHIHSVQLPKCDVCGRTAVESPDARVDEVLEMLKKRDGRKS